MNWIGKSQSQSSNHKIYHHLDERLYSISTAFTRILVVFSFSLCNRTWILLAGVELVVLHL